jgi:hypothetical protein
MLRCKTVEFLFDALPIGVWRAFLIRRHIDACSACQKKILSLEEARSLLVGPMDPAEWAGLKLRLRSRTINDAADRVPAGYGKPAKLWQWASGAAIVLVLAAAGFWLLRETEKEVPIAGRIRPPERFELDYIRVGGQPAGAYIYQPQGADMIIVWAEKAP